MNSPNAVRTNAAKQVSNLERRPPVSVSSMEGQLSILATESELLRSARVHIDAAQRDVAELAYITHTTLGDIESNLSSNRIHRDNVRKALLRIIAAKQEVLAVQMKRLLN